MLLPKVSEFKIDSGLTLKYYKHEEFSNLIEFGEKSLDIRANMCRLNIMTMIKNAGSGHLGSSFSSIELMLAADYFLNLDPESSINNSFFSSKGHDAPALYSVLHAKGLLPDESLFTLRRLGGLPGHPEIQIPGVETNTGSLGMGISKAKGFIYSNRINNKVSKVICLLGDGELQEGQIWESLSGAYRDKMEELTVLVDGNKIQSDTWVEKNLPIGNLETRVKSYGWEFFHIDGHDIGQILHTLSLKSTLGNPKFVYCSTIKGRGIPKMEFFPINGKFYPYHSGSINDEEYLEFSNFLINKISGVKQTNEIGPSLKLDYATPKPRPESLVTFWVDELEMLGKSNSRIVVLDGDLTFDTGTWKFARAYPARYVQSGIAEQDMVSVAGGISLKGKIPLVHSFATFLTMRSTEQIFNNASENSLIIYLGFLAGLLPSPPGFSHQAVTDVGVMSSIPNMQVIAPSTRDEFKYLIDWSLSSLGPKYFRIGSIANPIVKFEDFPCMPGNLNKVSKGKNVAVVLSGPQLLTNILEITKQHELEIGIYTYPFLNSEPSTGAINELNNYHTVIVLEDYLECLATFELLNRNKYLKSRVVRIGLSGFPNNGRNDEVALKHKMDANSILEVIIQCTNVSK